MVFFFLAFTWKNVLCHPKPSTQLACGAKELTEHPSHILQEVIYQILQDSLLVKVTYLLSDCSLSITLEILQEILKEIKDKQPKMGHKEIIAFFKTVMGDGKTAEYTMV